MSGARVRRAGAADLDALLALEENFPGDRLERRHLRHLATRAHGGVWVAELDGRVVGDAVLLLRRGDDAARLYSIVVAPEARGRGVASALLDVVEGHAAAHGRRFVRLEVREDNAAARALYARRGYAPIGRRARYYGDGAAAVLMRKRLEAGGQPSPAR